MKKIILFTLMPLFTAAWIKSADDSPNKDDSFEQLKKDFEEIRHKPNSFEHYAWFARCAKNEECRKSAKKNFETIPKEKLTEMLIDGMAFTGEYCALSQKQEEDIKLIIKEQKKIKETQKEIEEIYNEMGVKKPKNFERGYHFVVGGLLTSGGVLCILNNDNVLVKIFGGVSVAAGFFSFLRFLNG